MATHVTFSKKSPLDILDDIAPRLDDMPIEYRSCTVLREHIINLIDTVVETITPSQTPPRHNSDTEVATANLWAARVKSNWKNIKTDMQKR